MERVIEISVNNRIACQTNRVEYICGNKGFTVLFAFDGEWDNVDTKTARFIYGGEHTDVVFTGNECEVPVITDANIMEVGVYAGDLKTTTAATVNCKKSILSNSGLPADPVPDVYNQLMELLATIGIFYVKQFFTPFEEIVKAHSAGKLCVLRDTHTVAQLTMITDDVAYFGYVNANGGTTYWSVMSDNTWQATITNKTTTIDENSTHEQYPTAKAVYDLFKTLKET